jgi:type 1 glutamine amidotransferase
VGETRAPIRVLMVTATTGWRHTEAIDAAKQVMAEVDKTTELDVTVTEDVNVFTPATLAKYDVLFLSNSTLRVAEPDDKVERPESRNHDKPAPALTKAQEQAMLEFVRSGKGLVVTHSGVDAFYGIARLSRDDRGRPVPVASLDPTRARERGGARETRRSRISATASVCATRST